MEETRKDSGCICANCGEPLLGAYCAACGQKADVGRLSLTTLAGSLLRAIYDMDSKVWRTIADLTRNPGQVALDYIGGTRVRYVNPVKYFLTIYAISIALSVATGELDQNLQYSQQPTNIEELPVEQRAEVEEELAQVNNMLSNRMDMVTFLMVPILAVFMRLHNFRSGKNLAESLIFQCYVWGHFALLSIPLIATIYISPPLNFWAKNILMLVIFYCGLRVFYNRSWLRSLLSLTFFTLHSFIAALLSVNILLAFRSMGIF